MSDKYKLGSLFDGSGGFPLAGSLCGIQPVWASEIEPYPIAVTRSRFPDMRHLGDICKINGAEIEPVDIITFGSPCQDLSMAGKRAGLKHEDNGDEETTRSGLFMDAVRIIKEMRDATNGVYPTFALWENVPGAFSSNGGEDFRIVLAELIKIVEPNAVMPPVPKAGWAYADSYTGDGWSLAYRVFDAQYWGVPQRRRRIHLVVDFRGERAQKVLFEREGLRGYFAEGRTPQQGDTADIENCAGADDRNGEKNCITAVDQVGIAFAERIVLDDQGGQQINVRTDGKSPTLRAEMHGNIPAVMEPICCIDGDKIGKAERAGGSGLGIRLGDKMYTLTAKDVHCVACLIKPASFYPQMKAESQCFRNDGICNTLVVGTNPGFHNGVVEAVPLVMATGQANAEIMVDKSPSLNCNNEQPIVQICYIVRRLTPTECARLQGFADRWGDIDKKETFTEDEYDFWCNVYLTKMLIDGKVEHNNEGDLVYTTSKKPYKKKTKPQMLKWYNNLQSDSSEYKMWGNGIALPPALYCMQGIVDALEG